MCSCCPTKWSEEFPGGQDTAASEGPWFLPGILWHSMACQSAYIKMSPKKAYHPLQRHHVASIIMQHGSPCRCHTRCLPSPRCRMKQCCLSSLTLNISIHENELLFPSQVLPSMLHWHRTVCDCHDIALVTFDWVGDILVKLWGMKSID